MEKTRTTVRIAGREFTMVGTEPPEYMHRVALYVDRKMQEIAVATRLNSSNLATLTCLNIADELIKSQDDNARLRKELAEARQETAKLQRENTVLKTGRTVSSPPPAPK